MTEALVRWNSQDFCSCVLGSCMLWAECLCLPKFKYRNPNSLNVMVFRDAASEEVIKVKSCHEDGVLIR